MSTRRIARTGSAAPTSSPREGSSDLPGENAIESKPPLGELLLFCLCKAVFLRLCFRPIPSDSETRAAIHVCASLLLWLRVTVHSSVIVHSFKLYRYVLCLFVHLVHLGLAFLVFMHVRL